MTPWSRSRRTRPHMSRRSSTSTPAVGSSRNRMRGSWASALAIMTRRFMPPESVIRMSSRRSQSERSRSTRSMCAGSGRRPNSPRLNAAAARTVSKASIASSCGTSPMRSRAARYSFCVSWPSTSTVPEVGPDDAADDADERSLAGAVRTEQREDLAGPDVERHALQRVLPVGVGLGEVRDRDGGGHRHILSRLTEAPRAAARGSGARPPAG